MDIVLPVYRALRHVRACLAAIDRWTSDVPYRLIVVDDASGEPTARELARLTEPFGARACLLTNESNEGFLPTANRGMRAGDAPVVAVLNTDAFVTPGWLSGLLECLEADSHTGIVSPVSNYANLARIQGHYGSHYLAMAETVRRVTPRRFPEIRFANGACMVAWRSLLDELEYFDERYGRGYFEETDLCLRAAQLGWRTAADDATYVHHHGWGSFGASRSALMRRNGELFDQRWGEGAHRRIRRAVRRERPFEELERRVAASLGRHAQVRPRRELPKPGGRMLAEKATKGDQIDLPPTLDPIWWNKPFKRWQQIAHQQTSPPAVAADLLIILDDLSVNPWSTDALRIADLLLDRGIDVSVATTGIFDPALLADPCRLWPYVLSGPDEMLQIVRRHRVVLATSPATVYESLLLRERDGSVVIGWLQPDALASRPLWTGDAPALAGAAGLVAAQFHAGGIFGTGVPTHHAPAGVEYDVYQDLDEEAERSGVLLVHGAPLPPPYGHDAPQFVHELLRRDIPVTVYGHRIPEVEVPTVRLRTQEPEAELLAAHRMIIEVAPIPGLDRFRLRAAAAGVPYILASPRGDACALEVGVEVYGVARGDTARLTQLTLDIFRDDAQAKKRAAAARRRAQQLTLVDEAHALLGGLRALGLIGL